MAVCDGIGASCVRVRLREGDGSWLDEPIGVAGGVTEDRAASVDLVHTGEQVGRIDLGPKPRASAAWPPYGGQSRPPVQSARNTPGSVSWCCRSTQMRAMPGRSSMTAPAGLAYLLKDRVGYLEDLVPALNEVASGGSVVDPLIIDPLVARQQTRASGPLSSLTPRELDVLREMAQARPMQASSKPCFSPSRQLRSTSMRSSPSWAIGCAGPSPGRRRTRVPGKRSSLRPA